MLAPLLDLADPGQVIGPVVGHVDQTSARIWLRPRTPDFKLQLRDASGAPHVGARSELDGSYVIHVTGLRPGARYTYRLADEGAERTGSFRTAPGGEEVDAFEIAQEQEKEERGESGSGGG